MRDEVFRMSVQQFRSAAFGGFNKQDVLNYIETTNREHAAAVESLKKDLEEARTGTAGLEERAAAAEKRADEAAARAEQLSGNLRACAASLELARAEVEEKAARLEEAEARTTHLSERLDRLVPAAEAYEDLKDRTAGIELNAHHRAQSSVTEAEQQARQIRAALEQWIGRVQAGYDRLRTDVDATIAHADGELERVRKSLTAISAEFAEHDTTLEELLRTYREEGPKAPKPLPLDGE